MLFFLLNLIWSIFIAQCTAEDFPSRLSVGSLNSREGRTDVKQEALYSISELKHEETLFTTGVSRMSQME